MPKRSVFLPTLLLLAKRLRKTAATALIGAAMVVASAASANEALLLEITYQLDALNKNVATLQGDIEQLQNDVTRIKSTQTAQYDEFDTRIDTLKSALEGTEQLALQTQSSVQSLQSQQEQALAAATIKDASSTVTANATTNVTASTATTSEALEFQTVTASVLPINEEAARIDYEKAKQYALGGEYDEARQAFTQLAEQFPKSQYAGFSYYWLGQVELAYESPDLKRAQAAFEQVVERYPDNKRVPETLLRLAEVELALARPKTANGLLTRLIESYPKSRHVKEAKALQDAISANSASESADTTSTTTAQEQPPADVTAPVVAATETAPAAEKTGSSTTETDTATVSGE